MNVLHYEYTLREYVVAVMYSRKLGRSRVMILAVWCCGGLRGSLEGGKFTCLYFHLLLAIP